jgi:Tol biopolymer transport system component
LQGVGGTKLAINKKIVISAIAVIVVALVFVTLITSTDLSPSESKELVHDKKWGIYALDLETQETELVYSSENKISKIRLDNAGGRLVFAQEFGNSNECIVEGSPVNLCQEICSIGVDGTNYRRLTDNRFWDLIPCWTEDDSRIVFLSYRETLDIFMMNADGSEQINITPDYFPTEFLCHHPIFSKDDSKIFFVGEWYLD